jgi:hypothetical protein
MRRLSAKQIETLKALSQAGTPRGAYPGLHLGTLGSLEWRGLAAGQYGIGSIAMPHTNIKWRITEAGRAALSALEEGE